MVSAYDARGRRVGATVVSIQPNFVTQVKTVDSKDGYNGIQIGMGEKKSVRKPQIGHLKKAGIDKKIRFFKEVRTDDLEDVTAGAEVSVGEVFRTGDAVKVTGVSKGRGFAGGVKRHGFHGGPKTHGQSDRHRAPGSIGSGTTPGRVYKGKRMAGHMGVSQVSYKGVEVIAVDKANHLITLKGGVPGPMGGLVVIEKQGQIKGYTPPPEPEVVEEEVAVAESSGEPMEETSAVEAVGEEAVPVEEVVAEEAAPEAEVSVDESASAEASADEGGQENG